MRRILTTTLALALVAGGAATAQEVSERERQRQEQEEERRAAAQQRLQEAQQALQQALQMLQEAQSDEARARMREAQSELSRAMNELNRSRYYNRAYELYTDEVGPLAIAIGGSGARMGVYLTTGREAAETDSIGALLDRVVEDGPADEAGLEAGDIIISANGKPLARTSRRDTSPSNKLTGIRDELEIGDTLHVEYRRGSETRTAAIVLDELDSSLSWSYAYTAPDVLVSPDVELRAAPRVSVRSTPRGGVATVFSGSFWPMSWLEIELVELDEDLGGYFGTSEGLLVLRAPEDSEFDFRSGDVILDVDGRRPTDQAHLVRIIRSYEPGETMNIGIMRNRTHETVSVTVPERDDFNWNRRQ
ncbi:MAG: PDZ domain-containing protein [Gemmatimonadota bacterium]|nr:MAG: PDZ domain-containing protein [Gemmatimonadota bacterium]